MDTFTSKSEIDANIFLRSFLQTESKSEPAAHCARIEEPFPRGILAGRSFGHIFLVR
jgi:hypothetical protein